MSVVDTPPPHDPLHSGPFFDWSRHMQVCIQHCPSTEPYLIQDTVSQLLHPSYNIHIGIPLKRCAVEESLTLVCKRTNEATSGCEAKQTWNIMEPCLECVKMIVLLKDQNGQLQHQWCEFCVNFIVYDFVHYFIKRSNCYTATPALHFQSALTPLGFLYIINISTYIITQDWSILHLMFLSLSWNMIPGDCMFLHGCPTSRCTPKLQYLIEKLRF